MKENLKSGYVEDAISYPFKRYVQTMSLRDNQELIDEYRRLHSKNGIWPEILKGIRDCGIQEMEIFLLGTRLVMIIEAPIDFNWDDAMTKMSAGPRQAEWEALVSKYQQATADQRSDEKWQLMERIFHLYQ